MHQARVLLGLITLLAFATPAYASPRVSVTFHDPLEITCDIHRGDNGMVDAFGASANVEPLECDVMCRAYMQGSGWQDLTYGNEQAGLAGGGKRVEAVQMQLRGILANDYSLWYRVKVAERGWTGWAADGDPAGTMGLSLPIEDIQIQLLQAWEEPPIGSGEALVDNTLYTDIGRIRNKRKIAALGNFSPSKKAKKALKAAVKSIRKQGYDVGFVMMDLATHKGIAYNCGTIFYGASSIKAPYMAAAIERHPEAIKKYARQIVDTLVYSWDDTYKEVVRAYGEKPLMAWRKQLKLDSDFATFTVDNPWVGYTARDLAKLWVRIYQWSQHSATGEKFCSWSEYPETSAIHYMLGGNYRTQSKAGWIQTEYPYWNATDDGGLVFADNGTYVIAILSNVPANFGELYDLTSAIDAIHDEITP